MFSSQNREHRKETVLSQEIKNLNNTYKVSMHRMEVISDTINNTVFNTKEVLELLYKAKHADNDEALIPLRQKLYTIVKPHFESLKEVGVIITLFSFENNKTFLRVHKPNRFNDDLSKVRYSFKYVNENRENIRGLEEGKIMHAFRNVYPLFYRGEYLGSVDIAFSSEILREHMMNLYNTEAHFIINKNIFTSNIWKMKDMVHYTQSMEHEDFSHDAHDHGANHRIDFLEVDLNHKLKKEIYKNIEHGGSFSLEDSGRVLSFIPIKNIKENATVAYLISYIESDYLKNLTHEYILLNILAFIVLFLISLAIYINGKSRLELHIGLEKEVEDQNRAFKVLFEKASDGIIIIEDKVIIESNEAILKILEFDEKNQLLGKPASIMSPILEEKDLLCFQREEETSQATNFQRPFKNIDDEEIWLSITLSAIMISHKQIIHALIKDITKEKKRELELLEEKNILHYKANHDILTMLPNRALFNDRLQQSILTSHRNRKSFALMFIDLNKFKPINDTYGHLVGDKVLQTVSSRLASIIREEDTLARIGGDEFVILMQNLKLTDDAAILAKKIISSLDETINIKKHKLLISASIGISVYPHHATDADKLLKYADEAMYQAKNDKTLHYKFYTE
ncbi:MAG: diguanylate cyclase [Campylobacterota bacterium]|nr:diguanylate cyclase [Campylobacterota bacterium]